VVQAPVLEERVSTSKKLYFIFGGIYAGLGIPPFEFYEASRILEENRIFFRDFSQSWYQNGLPGIGRDYRAIGDYIAAKIEAQQPEEIFFVGNSMGGFAALLFAALSGQGRAIAFAPMTFISPWKRILHGDKRRRPQIRNTYRSSWWKRHVWDLKGWLTGERSRLRADIYVSRAFRLDCVHARELAHLPRVRIHTFDEGGHQLVKQLRDDGRLEQILSGGGGVARR
jgi:pimeloyl-ACP methyl ester carboxylesterase